MATREEQRQERRMRILEAALDLFLRRGYGATKIVDIAFAADMSMGLMFHYFESKEKLLEALVDMGVGVPRQTRVNIAQDDALDFFTQYLRVIFQGAKEGGFTARMFLFMQRVGQDASIPEHIAQKAAQGDTVEASAAVIAQGQRQGSIRPGDPMALAQTFWAAVQGVMGYMALAENPAFPQEEWLLDIIRNPAELRRPGI